MSTKLWRRVLAVAAVLGVLWVSALDAGARPAASQSMSAPSTLSSPNPPEPTSALTLVVGQIGEMSTRNLLPGIANNVPTSAVLYRVYDTVLLGHPVSEDLLPYIVKGADYDEDGLFEPPQEYGLFAERAGAATPLEITLYYDFNGIRWHDGVQMTPWDLYFSYHINAMNPRFNTDLRVLFCNPAASYDSCGRQLGAVPTLKNWQGEGVMPGDPALRVAVTHTLNAPFVKFYGSTIAPVMLPMHLWSRTGGARHADFGCAVWIPPTEATSRGIPECGNTDPSRWGRGIASTEPVPGSSPYVYANAEAWAPADADVVGHGPFRFVSWTPGLEAVVTRNEDFFTGADAQSGVVSDPVLASILKKPTTDGIRFLPFATADLCAAALNISAVDFCHLSLPPAVVPDLRANPAVALELNPEAGFFYMAYNMRKAPFGYQMNDPANDVGYWFRQAVAHLADKEYFVNVLLQGLSIVGHGFVSPANTFWYNDLIPKPAYDLTQARAMLDSPQAQAAGIGADPPGACAWTTPEGCRVLPGIGNATFEILTPEMSYDAVRATAGAMIAQSMRDVGLNANATQLPFATLVSRVSQPDFDLYILAWRIGGWDPDYLFSFFHSVNGAPTGQNYPGFQNGTFDAIIDASRAELDRSARRSLIFQAQTLLSDARPYEVLYYRTNVEGYRQDRWVNWSVVAGTIWNYWSLLGIRPPGPGSAYTITVDTAPPGLEVRVDGTARTAPYSFSCPEGTIVALDVDSPQGTSDARHLFASWSDGGAKSHTITCSADLTYRASFVREFRITLDTNPTGQVLVVDGVSVAAPYAFWCAEGSTHTASALDPGGSYRFVNWSDGVASPTRTIPCDGPRTLIANYIATFTVTVDTVPSGLQVLVDAIARIAPYSFSCDSGSTHTFEVTSPQGTGTTRYPFAGWTDGPMENPRTIVCAGDASYTARFGTDYLVSLDTSPGGLEVLVDGNPVAATYTVWCAAGDSLVLDVASPQGNASTRYVFDTWSDGAPQSRVLACDAAAAIIATFRTEHAFTASTSPTGLQVEIDGTARTAPYAFWCASESAVLVGVPTPQGTSDTRYAFLSWSDGGGPSHAVSCDASLAVTASFRTEHRLTIETMPTGLQVKVGGVAETSPFTMWCEEGSSPSLDVSSPQGAGTTRRVFSSWSDGESAAHDVACDAPRTLTATFRTEHQVSLTTSPAGLHVLLGGDLVVTPHAFWCEEGSAIDLEAVAQAHASRRYVFTSWSDGEAARHTVECASPTELEAVFVAEQAAAPESSPAVLLAVVLGILVAAGVALLIWRSRRSSSSKEAEAESPPAKDEDRKH